MENNSQQSRKQKHLVLPLPAVQTQETNLKCPSSSPKTDDFMCHNKYGWTISICCMLHCTKEAQEVGSKSDLKTEDNIFISPAVVVNIFYYDQSIVYLFCL